MPETMQNESSKHQNVVNTRGKPGKYNANANRHEIQKKIPKRKKKEFPNQLRSQIQGPLFSAKTQVLRRAGAAWPSCRDRASACICLKTWQSPQGPCHSENHHVPPGKRFHHHGKSMNISIFRGKTHYQWPCSIAMLVITRG